MHHYYYCDHLLVATLIVIVFILHYIPPSPSPSFPPLKSASDGIRQMAPVKSGENPYSKKNGGFSTFQVGGIYEDPTTGFPPYGVPSGTDLFPSYAERLTLVWYNKVRIDPILFRNNWIRPFMITNDNSWLNVFATAAYR